MLRVGVVFVGAAATITAITATSIYGLFVVCSDLLYVVVFPQLVCAVHIPLTNSYGSLFGLILSLVLRFLGGEPYLNIDPVIKYPWFDEDAQTQMFPFKTLIVVIDLVAIITISAVANTCAKSSKAFVSVDRKLFGVYDENSDSEYKMDALDNYIFTNTGYTPDDKENDVTAIKYNKTS